MLILFFSKILESLYPTPEDISIAHKSGKFKFSSNQDNLVKKIWKKKWKLSICHLLVLFATLSLWLLNFTVSVHYESGSSWPKIAKP